VDRRRTQDGSRLNIPIFLLLDDYIGDYEHSNSQQRHYGNLFEKDTEHNIGNTAESQAATTPVLPVSIVTTMQILLRPPLALLLNAPSTSKNK
jgi:hypothetical protein